MQKYPAVTLSLHLDNRMIDMVGEGIIIALRVGRIGDKNLIVRKLQQVLFVVAAPLVSVALQGLGVVWLLRRTWTAVRCSPCCRTFHRAASGCTPPTASGRLNSTAPNALLVFLEARWRDV